MSSSPTSHPSSPEATSTLVPKGTLKRLIGYFGTVKLRTAGVFVLVGLLGIMEIAQPWLIAVVLGRLAGDSAAEVSWLPGTYADLLIVLAMALALKHMLFYVSHVCAATVGQDLENGLRARLFHQVLALRFTYHDKNRSGETIAKSLRDMEKARRFFREVWFGYLELFVLTTVMLIVVFGTHWSYGLTVSTAMAVGITLCVRTAVRVAQIDRKVSDEYDAVSNVVQENVAGARVVRAFGQEPSEVGKFSGRMNTFSKGWRNMEQYWAVRIPYVMNAYHMALPGVLLVGTWRVSTGAGSLTETMAVLLWCRHVLSRVRPLMRLILIGQQAVASSSRVFEVLDNTDRMPEPGDPKPLAAAVDGKPVGHVRLEDVHFRYGEATPEILKGVDLDIPAGSSLGLIGVTGSGKSSLVQLLGRFYDPTSGTIRLDGTPLEELDPSELRGAVGLVFQEPFLFSGTVSENIAYANPGIDQATIERCASLAAAHEFVTALPKGYETIVGERGVSLSGGQRQRLTIARALAMDPRILIFDDATASVDALTEKRLFQGIRAAAEDRTTIVISQRVTSVRWCDRIAVLEAGVITAVGTHDELVLTSPLYAEIHEHQSLVRASS